MQGAKEKKVKSKKSREIAIIVYNMIAKKINPKINQSKLYPSIKIWVKDEDKS